MATCKFYRYKDNWYYKVRPGFEDGKLVDAHALDTILGVTGVHEVIVILPKEGVENYHVHIKNGFIVTADLHGKDEVPSEVMEFVLRVPK